MCTTDAVLEDLGLLREAADAADDLIENYYSVHLAKALDPLDPDDYKQIVTTLSNSMRRTNAGVEAKALREALDALDVDWPNMTVAQMDEVILASSESLAPIAAQTLPKISTTLQATGEKVVNGAKVSTSRRLVLDIGLAFNERDAAIVDKLVTSQTNFVTDEYGRRIDAYSVKARRIVGDGLNNGLSRDDIGKNLRREIGGGAIRRNKSYWTVVAAAHTNRSRVYGQLASYDEAGIETYTFDAVLDERTTEICRYMHGREFTTKSGLNKYDQLDALPEPKEVKTEAPWSWDSTDDDGNKVIVYRDDKGDKQRVAQIDKPGLGGKDRVGDYSKGLNNSQLEAAGIQMPPLHGMCRSTIVPVV